MSETLLLIFELIGTVSFAVSGAMTGLSKKMDLFGVAILGVAAAVGGGVIRDLLLGITPPVMFRNPVYAAAAVVTAIVMFFPVTRRTLDKNHSLYDIVLLVMDSVGLGVFTVAGINTAFSAGHGSMFLLVFVGVMTGCGGGVLRDVLAGITPYIFVRHFYASASLIGAVICAALMPSVGSGAAMACGAAVIIVLRLCAARYRWHLPRPKE